MTAPDKHVAIAHRNFRLKKMDDVSRLNSEMRTQATRFTAGRYLQALARGEGDWARQWRSPSRAMTGLTSGRLSRR